MTAGECPLFPTHPTLLHCRARRELITQLKITMQRMPTTDMIADIFTKCLDKTTFLKFRDQLMTEV